MFTALTPTHLRLLQGLAARYPGPSRAGSTAERTASRVDDVQSPHKQSLLDAIQELDQAARCELTALVWIGAGIYRADEWPIARHHAAFSQRDADLVYMIENGPFGDHLARGLERLADVTPALA